MDENAPDQPDFDSVGNNPALTLRQMIQQDLIERGINPAGFEPAEVQRQWTQQQLAQHGITATPEEARKLTDQKIIYGIKREFQQDLAKHGVHVSLEEASEIYMQRLLHRISELT